MDLGGFSVEVRKAKGAPIVASLCSDLDVASDEGLLRGYQSQIQGENLFRAVKQPYMMHGVFLKTPKRVWAMAYVMLLALLLYALIQQRVRAGLASEREQNPLVLHRIKVASPTGRTILEEFDSVLHLIVRTPDGQVEHRLQGVTEGGIRILRWLQLKRRPLLSAAGASLTLIQS